MRHSLIKVGLCAFAISLSGGLGAWAQDDASAVAQAEAARLLELRARQGLDEETLTRFGMRLETCRHDAAAACARLQAELETLDASGDGAPPLRLVRSETRLLPGSDGEIAQAEAGRSEAQRAHPQEADTIRPVVDLLTATPDVLDVDAGQTTLLIDYVVSDEGGSFLDLMLLDLEHMTDRSVPDITGGVFMPTGARTSGQARINLDAGVIPGDYRVRLVVFDGAGNGNDLSQPAPEVTIINSSADADAPVLDSLTITPDPLTLEQADGELTLSYEVRDVGSAGLEYLSFGLYQIDSPTSSGAVAHTYVNFTGESQAEGELTMTVPAGARPGEHYVSVYLNDQADNRLFLNHEDPEPYRVLTLINDHADLLSPTVNRLTVTPDAVETSDLGSTLLVEYELADEGGSGLKHFYMTLSQAEAQKRQTIYRSSLIEFDGAQTARGQFTFRLPPNFPTGAYYVGATLRDELNNAAGDGNSIGLATTQLIWVNEPGKRAFGPFPNVVEPDGEGRDIFRVTGLESGPPQQIEVAFRNPEIPGFDGAFSDCDLAVQPSRHSGGEYLILAHELAACGVFGSADIVFQLTPHASDLNQDIDLRRFRLSETGMLSDVGSDRGPYSDWHEGRGEAEFGPFEWTETPGSGRLHQFRVSGLWEDRPHSMEIAIAKAAVDGFSGAFTDCTIDIPLSEIDNTAYTFTGADLAACGDFRRADLSFRFVDIADYGEPITLTRLVTTAQGSITDFSFDQLTDTPIQPVSLSGGRAQVEAGPFEWTGDATAPTQNLFRISGLSGDPQQIEVAINNAAASGYDGAYTDCNLQIRPSRAGAHDYLISAADLADCGPFVRGDLSFRITAAATDMPDGVRVRRIAVGAHGDLTDFNFDHALSSAATIRDSGNGQSNVVLGPFEWTGDSTVGTQNVFRITGIDGLPTRIQAALADATSEGYSGSYLDCELTVRPGRASENDYVITSNDLADCGDFVRANITFRVHANTGQISTDVRMRRFAVTRTGGLTDFGFDNQ
ncbi:hypothetical protein [Oceanicaulis sp. MMSF_3324]|uniref:hypothetical protein n=1 Tax=Oceanicaulis sp. MMSF_3324 TaxID=3046702 RepID=UPI00273EDBF4|nr:hypothetical protein [Oceanicaulis sp. MMSF_3324]